MAPARRTGISLALVTTTLLTVLFGQTVARADDAAVSCVARDVPVTLGVLPETMAGTLCVPVGVDTATVAVLVPGATYNQTYWDFPYQPDTYNFRLAMNDAGYATFTVDRLGSGASSHPLSALLTSTGQAAAVHQVIQDLRAGTIGGRAFAKVVIGGHSLGSTIAILEAGTYHDDDGVLLTGIAHQLNPSSLLDDLLVSLRPAFLDPAFADKGYDPGYMTTVPGTREADFYDPDTTDPAVLAVDEATKDVVTDTELADGVGIGILTPYSLAITAPVLIADGTNDQLVCRSLTGGCASAAALHAQESPYYGAAACLQTFVLPDSGHDINLATDTGLYHQAAIAWANAFVGTGPTQQPVPAGACGS
jgi:hypothetical protein